MSVRGQVRVGIVGAGLMGREAAAAFGRWNALDDHPARPVLAAVADPDPRARAWFDRIETLERSSADAAELLADDSLDVLYLAVPHHLHAQLETHRTLLR